MLGGALMSLAMLLACVGLSASVRRSLPRSWAIVTQLVTRLRLLSPDQLLTRSSHVLDSTAAFLVSAGFLVVWLPFGVRDFRPVLARGWHAADGFEGG
jgi:hypothetical protein